MIKKHCVFALLPFICLTAAAGEAANHDEWCGSIGFLSESIMSSRQNGVPMQNVMEVMSKGDGGDRITTIAKGMVVEAYGSPLYQSDSGKSAAIVEFQNKWYRDCLNSR